MLQIDRREAERRDHGCGRQDIPYCYSGKVFRPCPPSSGLKSVTEEVKSDDMIIVDGLEGLVIIDPDEMTLDHYRKKRTIFEKKESQLYNITDLPAETTDGKLIRLKVNIEFPAETDQVLNMNAEGVGLFRSEFLFMNHREAATEESQYNSYREVLEAMGNRPVTIRTLDVGGDKLISEIESQHEANPLLGWRAIRFCLEKTDIFRTQIRALLRASHHGNLRIMFPMISGIEEFEEALGTVCPGQGRAGEGRDPLQS